jgi:hypothetical protein
MWAFKTSMEKTVALLFSNYILKKLYYQNSLFCSILWRQETNVSHGMNTLHAQYTNAKMDNSYVGSFWLNMGGNTVTALMVIPALTNHTAPRQ